MNQQDSKSASISPNGCGCLLLLMGIGVIGAIAVPSYLNKVWNIKQSEAKQYVSSINKNQQAYFVEKSVFSTSVKALGIGIKTETKNYKYSLVTQKKQHLIMEFQSKKTLKAMSVVSL